MKSRQLLNTDYKCRNYEINTAVISHLIRVKIGEHCIYPYVTSQ